MSRKIPLTAKEMNWKKKKITKRSTMNPYWLRKIFKESRERGRSENKMCEPSKGGMGSRLNTPSRILMKAMYPKSRASAGLKSAPKKRKSKPNTKATSRLEPGPAKLTHTPPHLGLRRFEGFTGTGFAHPKIMPPPVMFDIMIRNKGKATEPIGSI